MPEFLTINSVKGLPLSFEGRGEVKGFVFNQIESSKGGFIYEVNSGANMYYEVFKRVINYRFNCVSYPRSKSFGIWAWTFMDLNSAREKFNELGKFKIDNYG
ncbi:hypothetical protein H7U19_14980 [Hyunsoonleella sp. SJ7]|uniref:Uncharacterized protein n=1 Tax=Hyunsoonleella aquatilis TaxID=2762758 RepID=A0A923HAB0_9FLAO|nr:hypothetical protein [Hyunsoonleella aquatilis]MBC3759715.1 hypothetical protein [Hyunsoonleella aquatilis]